MQAGLEEVRVDALLMEGLTAGAGAIGETDVVFRLFQSCNISISKLWVRFDS